MLDKDAFELPPLSRDQVRSIDRTAIREYAMPSICLMENAGRGAAERIAALTPGNRIAVLCGQGNNGGDGFVVARHLELLGRKPHLYFLAAVETLAGDALTNWQIVQAAKIPTEVIQSASAEQLRDRFAEFDCLVDAMLGTGASGNPRGAIAEAIRAANAVDAFRAAIDLPSGLDCDTGTAGDPCFRADHTCTFVAPKRGFALGDAGTWTGEVSVVSIGAPAHLLSRFLSDE